jgi:hypothetical protein
MGDGRTKCSERVATPDQASQKAKANDDRTHQDRVRCPCADPGKAGPPARIACTGGGDFGHRGLKQRLRLVLRQQPSRRYGSSTCLAPGGMPENSALANLKLSDRRPS